MKTVTCMLCAGYGRFDDIECPACSTRGYIQVDAPSGAGAGEPEAAPRADAGPAHDAAPASHDDELQAAYVRGFAAASEQRRLAAASHAYSVGCAHVALLHLERRRSWAVAVALAFLLGLAAFPTVAAVVTP